MLWPMGVLRSWPVTASVTRGRESAAFRSGPLGIRESSFASSSTTALSMEKGRT